MTHRTTEPYRDVSGVALYEVVDDLGAPIPGPRVAVIAWMHGNEPVGEDVLRRLEAERGVHHRAGAILAVRANEQARALGLRHSPDGRDLNRLWDADTLQRLRATDPSTLDPEERRARELAPLLLACDAVLDLHSTSRPAPPFLLYRDDQRHALLAARLGVQRLVTGVHEGAVLDGGLACTVGLRPGERGARLGFTFEAGQHEAPGNGERAWAVTLRLLHALGVWDEAPALPPGEPEVYEVMERFAQAPPGEAQWSFVGFGGDRTASGRRGPPRRLVSFEQVEADEVILTRGGGVVRAASPFTMLMPAPTAEPGADLYFVCQARHGGLGLRERTDAEARIEAAAIERMVDLVDDDELAAGVTWAGFDDRLLLDLVADLVGRVRRLPEGHPHRRIAVVGRGDFGGDRGERRAGQRYRRAMRQAVADGVPIERLQLLRGASLGWIDRLTSRAMAERVAERRARTGEVGIELVLSAHQPHTLSLLIAGDVDRALREGDYRHVRVALLVEASTVRRSGADVDVRIDRAGLVTARPEVIRGAWRMRDALRTDHRALLRRFPLASDPALAPAFDAAGRLGPSEDPAVMRALRVALRRVQLTLWRDALPRERLNARALDADGVATWLADTAVASGIRDLGALRALIVPDAPGRWRVDPERLDAACADPLAFAPTPPPPAGPPPVPMQADEVDADTLERWVGWKRFLRRAQPIPHTRGKDVDLALTGADIHRRVQDLYRRASALAAERQVLVVVAGDGQSPLRIHPGPSRASLDAHRALLRDPAVSYLRIQHLPGTNLAWLKDLLALGAARPAGAAPVRVALEEEHGALISVVALAVCETDHCTIEDFTLEGWRIEAAGVIVTDFDVAARDYALGLFTGPLPGEPERVNLDLLHFVRAHCQGLLDQLGSRSRIDVGVEGAAFEALVVQRIARWVETARAATDRPAGGPPRDRDGRRRWIAEELDLADPTLIAALADALTDGREPLAIADALWRSVRPWPGEALDA